MRNGYACITRFTREVKETFLIEKIFFISEYERHSSLYDPVPSASTRSTDIPEEVLNFLHSRNFHPEELENLKSFLQHGGSPQDETFLSHSLSSACSPRYAGNSRYDSAQENYRRGSDSGRRRERELGTGFEFEVCMYLL